MNFPLIKVPRCLFLRPEGPVIATSNQWLLRFLETSGP